MQAIKIQSKVALSQGFAFGLGGGFVKLNGKLVEGLQRLHEGDLV